tara:strand:- start:1262 stop:1402 length:141 start_codon:yes stop_codon:yes gene_type:complete
MRFTKEELAYIWESVGNTCSPLYDKGTKKYDLTKSIMKKLEKEYNK